MNSLIAYFSSFFAQTYTVARRELQRILSDGGVMLLFFGATLIYPLIYGVCYYPEVLRNVPVAIIDMDNSPESRRMIRMIESTEQVKGVLHVSCMEEAKQAFYEGAVSGVVLIPNDFSTSLMSNRQTSVVVYADASYLLVYKQTLAGVTAAIQQFNVQVKTEKLTKAGVSTTLANKMATPVQYLSEPLYNPSSGYGSYAMPALLILILQQSMLIGIGMLAGSERERGLRSYIEVLSSVQGRVARLMFGKVLAYSLIYLPISLYMLYLVPHWFGFPFASTPWEILKFVLPLLLSVSILGLLLSTLFRSREQSIVTLVFTSIPIVFLSGFSWPVESFPAGFRYLAALFPSSHAIKGYLKLAVMDTPFAYAIDNCLWMWLLAASFALATGLILRWFSRRLGI